MNRTNLCNRENSGRCDFKLGCVPECVKAGRDSNNKIS